MDGVVFVLSFDDQAWPSRAFTIVSHETLWAAWFLFCLSVAKRGLRELLRLFHVKHTVFALRLSFCVTNAPSLLDIDNFDKKFRFCELGVFHVKHC